MRKWFLPQPVKIISCPTVELRLRPASFVCDRGNEGEKEGEGGVTESELLAEYENQSDWREGRTLREKHVWQV